MIPASGTASALPAFDEWVAEPTWPAIDFISDLHLSDTLPRTAEALFRHLAHTPAPCVILLGDLFELWVGDDQMTQPVEASLVQRLAEAAGRRRLAFMVGNRDFLAGAQLLRAAGLQGLNDPTVLAAFGRRVLLSHGDALCLDDQPYQAFRREVRSPAWQQAFLARPLAERLHIAAEIRQASKTRHRFDGDGRIDIDPAEALRWLRAAGADTLVHGHTHRPSDDEPASGLRRHVLTDWDLDHGSADRAGVLRLTRDGFVRVAPAGG